MSEFLYTVQELYTNGWVKVRENLTRAQASEVIQNLMNEGISPDRLRAVREN